jgi:hypothetical protein
MRRPSIRRNQLSLRAGVPLAVIAEIGSRLRIVQREGSACKWLASSSIDERIPSPIPSSCFCVPPGQNEAARALNSALADDWDGVRASSPAAPPAPCAQSLGQKEAAPEILIARLVNGVLTSLYTGRNAATELLSRFRWKSFSGHRESGFALKGRENGSAVPQHYR